MDTQKQIDELTKRKKTYTLRFIEADIKTLETIAKQRSTLTKKVCRQTLIDLAIKQFIEKEKQ